MSSKRFKLDFDNCSDGRIMDRKDKYGQYCRLYDFGEVGRQQIVDLLNSLCDENEQLRKDCTILVQSNQEYRKENEKLRKQLKWKKEEIKALLEEDDNDE